jgi:hypothetical protein
MKLELGCGTAPSAGYVHHDRRRHSPHIDVVHNLEELPWPWENHRILAPGGVLRLRVPVFGSPWHLIDPTHVRGFHPLNFDYFIRGRELWQKYGHYYFGFSFQDGEVNTEEYNIIAKLIK